MSFLKAKRTCEDDPKEVLVIASKKSKLQDISDQVPIFELASAAVENDVQKIRTRIREDNKERIKNNRYKLWTVSRKLDDYRSTNLNVTDPDFTNNHVLHDLSDKYDWNPESEDEQVPNDEDDSNDETNWRNDYPDEENSEGENSEDNSDVEYLTKKMRNSHFSNSSSSLSYSDPDCYDDPLLSIEGSEE